MHPPGPFFLFSEIAHLRYSRAMAARRREKITSKTCLSCGACCVAPQHTDAFCDVTPQDMERFGKKFVRLHVIQPRLFNFLVSAFDGGAPHGAIRTTWRKQRRGPHRGFELLTCAMLAGNVGESVRCRIYDKRPNVCHNAVKPGDPACRAIRTAFQDEVDNARERTTDADT